ncbi:alpha/beta fold hydrolase [Litoribrevibacter euphylliae]|uniref:Alpha/beta fold hydrolase n=1 Tax=Litoribrevibacter euphylliae TaxID=1834034 RepID=A0ABV7HLM3_9GAMM
MVNILFKRSLLLNRLVVFFGALLLSFLSWSDPLCESLSAGLADQYPTYIQKQAMNPQGRIISWSRVGSEDGKPVFYAHGNPGSRFELLFFHEVAEKENVTFYLMERPGFGCSEFVKNYSLLDYAQDLKWFISFLKIDTPVNLMGWSSGGPPMLSFAKAFPDLTNKVVIASSYSDFGEMAEAKALMRQYHRPGPMLSDKTPRLFHGLVSLVGWASHKLPNVYFRVTEKEVSKADRMILESGHIKPLFLLNQDHAFAQGAQGAIQDLEVQWQPWPFDLASIMVPVLLLQGGEDQLVPKEFARHLHQNLAHSTLQLFSDQGHLFVLQLKYQREALMWLGSH